MTEQLILEKLETLEKQSDKLDKKVDKIEIAVGLIAVQSERINNMQIQVQSLWEKYDQAFGQAGSVDLIKQFQASCPRVEIGKSLNRLWWAVGALTSVMAGCLLKSLGGGGG